MAVEVNQEKCTACGQCVEICPVEAITMNEGQISINQDDCSECGACESECPSGAIEIN